MRELLSYIDTAKGILILIVVMHHMPQIMIRLGIDDSFVHCVNTYDFWYHTYFMPAFFVITGFVSRIKEEETFLQFLYKNIKTILLPGFVLGLALALKGGTGVITYLTEVVGKGMSPYWFLTALFVAKVIHWLINRGVHDNVYVRAAVYLALVVIGVLLNELGLTEYWCVYHALVLAVFLFVGQELRKVEVSRRLTLASAGIFAAGTAIGILTPPIWQLPYVTAGISLSLLSCPLYLILATTGSVMMIGIAKEIGSNKVLEFYGRNSLVVYCLHVTVVWQIVMRIPHFFDVNILLSALTFVAVFLLTILILYVAILILNLKYIRCLIGKF